MSDYEYSYVIYHSGIKGMKWGIRRYQNEDGSLTDEGRARYRREFGRRVEKLKSFQSKKEKFRAKASAKLKYKIARAEKRATRFRRKMAKYDLKAARAENRAARRLKRYEKYQLKEAKYDKKAYKYAEKTLKKYSNVPLDALNKSDYDYVNNYYLEKSEKLRKESV